MTKTWGNHISLTRLTVGKISIFSMSLMAINDQLSPSVLQQSSPSQHPQNESSTRVDSFEDVKQY